GFTDKGAAAELGRRQGKLAASRALNASPDPAIARWLGTIPSDLRDRLPKIGRLDPRTVPPSRPLFCPASRRTGPSTADEPCKCHGEHISDFRQSILNKGGTPEHAELITARLRKICERCGFTFYSDISASRVQQYLADERKKEKGISAQTSNFYLQAIKQ